MTWLSVLAAGLAYFALGGLWFTPLFGRQWDRAIGFERPPHWRPSAAYYLGPLIGCLAGAAATAVLLQWAGAVTLLDSLRVGAVAGLGFSAAVTGINAITPHMPRPGLYAAVVGSYHALGVCLCAAVLHLLGW
jgi:Protein of unknown function (DUF1761)